MARRTTVVWIPLLSLVALNVSYAQTWSGTNSGSWSDGGNWFGGSRPVNSVNTHLIFGSATTAAMTDDIAGTFALNEMDFTAAAPAYTLSGNGLGIYSTQGGLLPSIVMNSANAVSIANLVTLNNNLTVSGTGTGALTFSGSVNTTTGTMTYAGAGTLDIQRDNRRQ